MKLTSRVVGAVARRVGRPELLAAVDVHARRIQSEAIGVRAVLAGTLSAGSTYVDVGANRGQVLREAVRVAPWGRHYAFEPIPSLAQSSRASFPTLIAGASPSVRDLKRRASVPFDASMAGVVCAVIPDRNERGVPELRDRRGLDAGHRVIWRGVCQGAALSGPCARLGSAWWRGRFPGRHELECRRDRPGHGQAHMRGLVTSRPLFVAGLAI